MIRRGLLYQKETILGQVGGEADPNPVRI